MIIDSEGTLYWTSYEIPAGVAYTGNEDFIAEQFIAVMIGWA